MNRLRPLQRYPAAASSIGVTALGGALGPMVKPAHQSDEILTLFSIAGV